MGNGMTVGQIVKRRRKELGLTQRQLGERAGISDTMIGAVERDSNNFSFFTAFLVCEVLDLSLDELAKGFRA